MKLGSIHDNRDVKATVEVGMGVVSSSKDTVRVGSAQSSGQGVDTSVGFKSRGVDTRGEGLRPREHLKCGLRFRPGEGVDEPLAVGRGADLSWSIWVRERDSGCGRIRVNNR